MILYVNGDSHSAAAEAAVEFCFADEDYRYPHLGRQAHPDNQAVSYGRKLADIFKLRPFIDAESASSNARILRTTREYIRNHQSQEKLFVIIGWTNWEREEWLYNDQYLQITSSGTDSVPEELRVEYMIWVDQQVHKFTEKEQYWHNQIVEFHRELQEQNIPHFFFNCFHRFSNIGADQWIDWKGCYYHPYEVNGSYNDWCRNSGYSTVKHDSYHFGSDAHAGWANHLIPYLTPLL